MTNADERKRWRFTRASVTPTVSGLVTVALVASAALLTSGYKPVETDVPVSSVWLINADKQSAGRVNLQLEELDAFAPYDTDPALTRVGSRTYALLAGVGLDVIDETDPRLRDGEIGETSLVKVPSGVTAVTGDSTGLLFTGGGSAYRAEAGSASVITRSIVKLDVAHVVAAASVGDGTSLVLGQAQDGADHEVFRVGADGAVTSVGTVTDFDAGAETQLAAVGDGWIILSTQADGAGSRIWTSGSSDGAGFGSAGARLQGSSQTGSDAYIAGLDGLWRVALDDPADATQVVSSDAIGGDASSTALTVTDDGCAYAAWATAEQGSLVRVCSSDEAGVPTPLEPAAGAALFAGDPQLDLIDVGGDVLVNDQKSGHAWRASGQPIVATWDWTDPDQQQQEQTHDQNPVPPDEQKPPVARNDEFGVRAGVTSTLPALLNDSDPNGDPFVIATDDVGELSGPAGATREVVNNVQEFTLNVPARTPVGATYTFSYRVTDGTEAGGGRYSNTATVTARVVDDSTNTAPVFVGDEALYSYSIASGESVTVPALKGWMDPEGDAMFVKSATFALPSDSEKASVVVTSGGDVVFKHADPQDSGKTYAITVVVADGRGGESSKTLTIVVSSNSALTADDFAQSTLVNSVLTVDVASRTHGTRSAVSLTKVTDAIRGDSTPATLTPSAQRAEFAFTSPTAGTFVVQYTVTSGGAEATGTVIIRVIDPSASPGLSIAPQSVAVGLNSSVLVNVLDALQGAQGHVAMIAGAVAQRSNVTVGVVDFARLRVSPNDNVSSRQAGELIDVIDYRVTAGASTTTGQLSVFLKPTTAAVDPPIAVSDAVTVVSGGSVDIPVLVNDIEPSGGTLTLDPRVTSDSPDAAQGVGIYFPSRSVLRYLAPTVTSEQTFTIPYVVYGPAGQVARASGTVSVTVVPASMVTMGLAVPDLVGRVASGQSVTIAFSPYGVSAINETVRITAIEAPSTGSATIAPDGLSIIYQSPVTTKQTQVEFGYTVSTTGATRSTGTGMVRVAVSAELTASGPTAVTDYLTVPLGGEAYIDPVLNDEAPQVGVDQTLRLGTTASGDLIPIVELNSKDAATLTGQAGESATALPDATVEAVIDKATGRVTIRAKSGSTPGDGSSYALRYVVQDSRGGQDIGRIMVTFAANPVPEYPVVFDSTVSAKDYAGMSFSKNVVSGRVTWASGDVTALRVSAVAGATDIVTITGSIVSGRMPDVTSRVLLKFEGTASDGTVMASYGFLTITGVNDISPELKDPNAVAEVMAGESTTFDMMQLLAIPSGFSLQAVTAVEPAASKGTVAISGTTVTFTADKNAGGLDFVRVAVATTGGNGSSVTTSFALRVKVNPTYPELIGSSYTIDPDETLPIDLTKLVTWYGHSESDIASLGFSTSGDATSILSTGNGRVSDPRSWAVHVKPDAAVGHTASLTLSLDGQPNTPSVTLTFTVGSKLRNLPTAANCSADVSLEGGGVVSQTFRLVGNGDGCGGERNSYPSAGLTIVPGSVVAPSTAGVSVSGQSTTGITLSFDPSSVFEGSAVVKFSVSDAQGQVSAQQGSLTITIKSLPRAPIITDVRGGDRSVSIDVTPASVLTSPGITAYAVTWSGAVSGSASKKLAAADTGATIDIGGLPNGANNKLNFSVCAVNSLGQSRDCATVSNVYAQRNPAAPTFSVVPQPGAVSLTIDRPPTTDTVEGYRVVLSDSSTFDLPLSAAGRAQVIDRQDTRAVFTVNVIALAHSYNFAAPGDEIGTNGTAVETRGQYAPRFVDAPVATMSSGGGSATVTARVDFGLPAGVPVAYCAAEKAQGCVPVAQAAMSTGKVQEITITNIPLSAGSGTKTLVAVAANGAVGGNVPSPDATLVKIPSTDDLASYTYTVTESRTGSGYFVPVVDSPGTFNTPGLTRTFIWNSVASASGDWRSGAESLAGRVFTDDPTVSLRVCQSGYTDDAHCATKAVVSSGASSVIPTRYALSTEGDAACVDLDGTLYPRAVADNAQGASQQIDPVLDGTRVTYRASGGPVWTPAPQPAACAAPPEP